MKKESKRFFLLTALILVLAAAVGTGSAVFADGERNGIRFGAEDLYQTTEAIAAFPHTWEAWIRVDKNAPDGRLGIVIGGYGGAAATAGVEINTNGRPDLWWTDGKASQHVTMSGYDIRSGEWTFLAVTNTEKEVCFYINGELKKTLPVSLPVLSDNAAGRIALGGDFRDGNGQSLKSTSLSSAAIYREVRTAEQIRNDYAAFDPSDASLLGMWDLSVSGSARLNDLSDAGMNLVYKNTKDPSKNEPKEEPSVAPEDGMAFSAEPVYKSGKPLSSTPNTFEATLWLPKEFDSSARAGIIAGNYGQYNPCFSFEIAAGGVPRLYWVNKKNEVLDWYFRKVNVRTGKWVTLAIVRDTVQNKLFCYVDGVLKETQNLPDSEDIVIGTPFAVGGDLRSGNAMYFKGKLKNVALYADARSAGEIAADFTAPGRDKNGLLAFFALDEGSDPDRLTDGSGNGYDMKPSRLWIDSLPAGEDYAYSFAVVGDTQIMNYSYPDGYVGIYDWILDSLEEKKIACVIGLGDITDRDSAAEWKRAQEQIGRMSGVVPFTMVRGNHDSVSQFNKYMKVPANLDQLEGTYGSGADNAWRTLSVGGTDYLILVLEYGARDAVLNWADKVIDDHPDHKVIVTTHCYLFRDGTTLDDGDVVPPSQSGGQNDGDDLWEKFVSKHENIVMVLSGHDPCGPIVMTPAVGDYGNTVCQFLIDPQGVDVGIDKGTGLVALFCFSEDGNRCRVEYYSTVRKQYYLSENQFIFDLRTGERVEKLNEATDTEPVTEPETEPVTEPVTEPITEPVTEPVTEAVTEPVTEPVTEAVTETVTDPVTDAGTEALTDPDTSPVPETDATETDASETDEAPGTEKKSGALWIAVGAAALAVIAVGAVLLLKKKKKA